MISGDTGIMVKKVLGLGSRVQDQKGIEGSFVWDFCCVGLLLVEKGLVASVLAVYLHAAGLAQRKVNYVIIACPKP